MLRSWSKLSGLEVFGITETSSCFQISGHFLPPITAEKMCCKGVMTYGRIALMSLGGGSTETEVLGLLVDDRALLLFL